MINKYAPIVPYREMGGIKLYSTIKQLAPILTDASVKVRVLHNRWIIYNINDVIELYFHLMNGKLFRICTMKNYRGKLFDKIRVGMRKTTMLKIESSFFYDDMDEVYMSDKGVFVEFNTKGKAEWISIYIKELEQDDFEEANW